MQAKLKAVHEVVVRNRLEQLGKRQRDEAFQAQEELLAGVAKAASTRSNINAPLDVVVNVEMSDEIVEDMEAYDRAMSPSLLDITKLSSDDRQIDIILEEDDRRNLVSFEAVKVFAFADEVLASSINNVVQSPLQGLFRRLHNLQEQKSKAKKHLDEEEELLNLEEDIVNPTTYNWEDKYRPRKPSYFNRVHTGYEWNKYNQTRYECVQCIFFCDQLYPDTDDSTDNPPPKVVQGYKVGLSIHQPRAL